MLSTGLAPALASHCVSVPLELALFFTHSGATLILVAFLLNNPTSLHDSDTHMSHPMLCLCVYLSPTGW